MTIEEGYGYYYMGIILGSQCCHSNKFRLLHPLLPQNAIQEGLPSDLRARYVGDGSCLRLILILRLQTPRHSNGIYSIRGYLKACRITDIMPYQDFGIGGTMSFLTLVCSQCISPCVRDG